MNFVSALKIQASAVQKCGSRPITCDFSTDAVCLSHIGLISIPLSRSLSPCWKNSSMILSVHCRYSSRDFVGLLKSAQCTIFRRTCNYINQKTHKIKWGKRTVSSCICLLNSEHLTTRLFDYATAYKNIHIETSPYMRPAATVCLKSRMRSVFFRRLDTYTGRSCGNAHYIIQVCFWMQVLPTIQNWFPRSQMVKCSYFVKWVISLPHAQKICAWLTVAARI